MGLLSKEIARLQKLKSKGVDRFARRSVTENQNTILDVLKTQLHHGEVGERPYAAPHYSEKTQEFADDPFYRPRQSQYGDNQRKKGRYNFEWSGKFFDSMKIKFTSKDFEINSSTISTNGLLSLGKMKRFSHSDLTTLSKKNNDDILEKIVEPDIYKEIESNLGKIFN